MMPSTALADLEEAVMFVREPPGRPWLVRDGERWITASDGEAAHALSRLGYPRGKDHNPTLDLLRERGRARGNT